MPRSVPAVTGDEAIRAAQDNLLSVERSMTVTGDPAAPVFGALAEFTGMLHRQGQDTAAVLVECRQAIAATQHQGLTDDQVRQITFRMVASSDQRVKDLVWKANLRNAAIAAAAVLGLMLVSGSIGWFGHGRSQAMVTNCTPAPQQTGGEAFTCTFWTKIPPK